MFVGNLYKFRFIIIIATVFKYCEEGLKSSKTLVNRIRGIGPFLHFSKITEQAFYLEESKEIPELLLFYR